MTTTPFTSSTGQECSANTTEYVVQMPCEGGHTAAKIPTDTATEFAFIIEDMTGVQIVDGGALLISFKNGGTLTLENFEEVANTGEFDTINFADGEIMNLDSLLASLSEDALANVAPEIIALTKPVGAIGETALVFDYVENVEYVLDVEMEEIAGTTVNGDVLTISFVDGAEITLNGFGVDGEEAAQISLQDGSVISASELITVLGTLPVGAIGETAMAFEANEEVVEEVTQEVAQTVREIAAIEPAAAAAPQKLVKTDTGSDVASVEPAAGDNGAQGGLQNTGAGFGSGVQGIGATGIAAVGPIAPTALQFNIPDVTDDNALLTQAAAVPGVPVTPPNDPSLTVGDVSGFEDNLIDLAISATPDVVGGTENITVTISNIPTGWGVSGPGTFDPTTGVWTYTVPGGQPFTGGPQLLPPADDDCDLSGADALNVSVVTTDTATGAVSNVVTDTMDVVVDAVADVPNQSATDIAGFEDTDALLNINFSLNDTDGSEEVTSMVIDGVPAGFTLVGGTDLGGGQWSVTPAALGTLALRAPDGYSGDVNLQIVTTVEEVHLCGLETTTTNNTATVTTPFVVSFEARADAPSLIVDNPIVKEDGSVDMNITATLNDPDGSEFLTVTVTGIDNTWTINNADGTYNAATGTWTITLPAGTDYTGVLNFTPPADSDVDMSNINVSATAEEPNGSTSTAQVNVDILTDAVADAPTLTTADVTGVAGTSYALNISSALTDLDGSETLSAITITGVPTGFSLSAGTDLGGGVWEVAQADLVGLQLNTPAGFNGTVPLGVSVTSTESVTDGEIDLTDNTATTTGTIDVTLSTTATPPTVTVAGTHEVYEDGTIIVPFQASLNGTGTEVLTVTVTGIDNTWTINNTDGTYNSATGTWTITLPAGTDYTGGLTFTPPADSDIDMTGLTVTASAYDTGSLTTATTDANTEIVVDAVADAPTLVGNNSAGEAGTAVALDISSALTDLDGSETLSVITVTGVPAGFSLNQGTDLGGGIWELTVADLTGLALNTPDGYDGNVTLGLSVTSTESVTDSDFDLTNNTATTTDTLVVSVSDSVTPPTVTVAGTHEVYEDGSITVPFSASLNGSGETLTVTVTGIDNTWTVNNADGTYNAATGTWTITLPAGTDYTGGLTFTPPADSDVDMTGLTVTATAEKDGNSLSVNEGTEIIVDAVADAPTLDGQNASGNSNSAINLTISNALTDTDGSETLGVVTITGVPAGFSLNQGTDLGGGSWSVTQAQLTGLQLNVPDNYSGDVTLGLSVTSTEGVTDDDFDLTNNTATTIDTLVVSVTDLPDTPTLNVAGEHQVKEDGTVLLPISASLNGSSREVLTVTVEGIDNTWTINNADGTYNAATGTWTITLPAGTDYTGGLSFTPPADSDVDMTGLTVTATAFEPSSGTSSSVDVDTSIVVDAVADQPTLVTNNVNTEEGQVANLNISTAVTDTDGSETITKVEISGVPAGFSLNNGVDLGGGVWQLSPADLAGLQLTPPANYYGTLDLTVTSYVTDTPTDGEFDLTDNTAQISDTLTVNYVDRPNPPTLDVDGVHQVHEDGSVYVPFSAALTGSPNEVLTVTVSGIDSSWTIMNADGVYNPTTGTWTITMPAGQDYSGGLTFSPPADSDLDMTGINVSAEASLPSTGDTSSVTEVITIITDAVADAPDLIANSTAVEAGNSIALDISAGLNDTDGSETLGNITLSGVPSGFSLNQGTNLGGGVWELTPAQLNNLRLNTPDGYDGTLNLSVSVTSTEQVGIDFDFDLTNNTATTTDTFTVTVNDPVEIPTVTVAGTHEVYEDGSITVPFTATLNGANETLTVTVTGIDNTWTINNADGTYNPATGTWTITMPAGQNYTGGLTFTPPADSDVDMTGIVVTATAIKGTEIQTASQNTSIIVDAVADAPTLTIDNTTSGDAADALPLNIAAALVDTDGSETLSTIIISEVPSGYDFNQGTDLGGGRWEFTESELSGLTITPPQNASGVVSMTVTVRSTESVTDTEITYANNVATTTQTLVINVTPDSIPEINPIAGVSVDEANLDGGTVTVNGTVTADFGSDSLGEFCIPAGGTFRATGEVAGGSLTSGGIAILVTIEGNKYVGKAGSETIFELTLNTDGTYTFQQFGPLDHADTNSSNEVISLNFDIKVEDSDGDVSETATLTVRVEDDGVVAMDDWVCLPTCDGYVNGNVMANGNASTGDSADNLSVDVANKITGVYDKWGNLHEIQEGQSVAIQGEFGKLYIGSDGSYTYQVEEWGESYDYNPTAADFGSDKQQFTRDGITLTATDPLYGGQTQGLLTWTGQGIGITGNGSDKINSGETVQIDFEGNGVYNVRVDIGGVSTVGTKVMDYCVVVALKDGTMRTIYGQKAIPVSGGNSVFTLDTWNDLTDPDIVSIVAVSIYSENTTPFDYVITDISGQEHLYEEFEYVLSDGDGDTDTAILYLQAKAADTTFNADTIYVGTGPTDPGSGVANGDDGENLIIGYTLDDTLRGFDGNDGLAGWTGNDSLYGGAGNDILLGEAGSDQLWGGSGSDIFVVDATDGGAVYDQINDFNASEGDVIDLSSLIESYDPADPINQYVRVIDDGGQAMIQVNSDGAGNDWTNAIRVDNQTAANMDVEELFQNGNIDVT